MFKKLLAIFAILAAFTSLCMGKEAVELEEVVVTATRGEKKIEDVPVSASVVTKDEVEKIMATFVDEALKYEAGAYLKRGKFADTTNNVTLRGFTGNQRTLVLLDGQPLNDAYNGGVEWSAIPLENVEKIEVVKGPASSLYGGYAMAGVINIITKTPKKEGFSIKSSASAYNTYHHSLGYGNKIGNLAFLLNFEKKSSEGERTNLTVKSAKTGDGDIPVTGWEETKDSKGNERYLIGDAGKNYWDQDQYSGKFTYSINPTSNLSLSYTGGRREYGYRDPQSYLKDAAGKPVDDGKVDLGNGKYISIKPYDFLSSWGKTDNNIYHFSYESLVGAVGLKGKWTLNDRQSFWVGQESGATAQGGPGKLNETSPNNAFQLEAQSDIPFRENDLLTIGLNYRTDKVEAKEWKLTDWKDEDSRKTTDPYYEAKGKARASAVYAQAEVEPVENLTLFLGSRYDAWKNYDGSCFDDAGDTPLTEYEDKEKSAFSPKVGLLYKPEFEQGIYRLDGIRASWGKAFRPPTAGELYRTWSYGSTVYESNPDLDPETSQSWEIGLDQRLGEKIRLSGTYFQSEIEGLIYNQVITSTLKRKENAGEGKISGFELEAKANLAPCLDAFGNYTCQDTEYTSNPADPNSVGKNFERVPEKMCNLGLAFHKEALTASCIWHWVEKVYGNSDNSDKEEGVYGAMDPVNTVDVKMGYTLKDNLRLSLAVDNLFDKEYYQYYKAPGRTFTVEARYEY
ncbi:MAG: TonB-dependent receptor [bacterium]|nr:TonB-dependent receptor [bacterium]